MQKYFDIAFTPSVTEMQTQKGSRTQFTTADSWAAPDRLDQREAEQIEAADHFYLASVGESGWPYVQHRGGDSGFVTVVDDRTIGWIERTGNRQYLSAGNVSASDKVAMIFLDYPTRTRLKLYGHATHHAVPSEEMIARLGGENLRSDGAVTVSITSFDWNCPKYITPRFTAEEVQAFVDPLKARIAELETQVPLRDVPEGGG